MKLRLASAASPPPEHSPEREALAAAIERRASRLAAISKLEAAANAAENRVYDLVHATEVAEKALKEGPEKAAAWQVAQAMGDDAGARVDMNALRSAVSDCKEQADIAREARGMLSAALAKSRTDLGWAEMAVEDARNAVMKSAPGIAKLVEELAVLYEQVLEKGKALHFLHMKSLVNEGTRTPTGWTEIFLAGRMISRFQQSPLAWAPLREHEGDVTVTRWREAYEALKSDANAPLPE